MLTIEHKPKIKLELDKRTYAPYILRDVCPNCKEDWELDLSEQYLVSNPKEGKTFDVVAYCNECGHEWVAGKARYRVVVELVK